MPLWGRVAPIKRMNFPLTFLENHVAFFPEKAQKPQHKILDERWPPPSPPPLELIRKFIRFGTIIIPQGRIAKA